MPRAAGGDGGGGIAEVVTTSQTDDPPFFHPRLALTILSGSPPPLSTGTITMRSKKS